MSSLLNDPTARTWAEEAMQRHSEKHFGRIASAVIWSNERGDDGELLVAADPSVLVHRINDGGQILLHDHDPGKPLGRVIEAADFMNKDGTHFVAAILGFYVGGASLGFHELGIDVMEDPPLPDNLPPLPTASLWIEIAADPREIDQAWLNEISEDSPLSVKRTELSHNTAAQTQELIRIGLVYLSVAWNPFTKALMTEAGKRTYNLIHEWLASVLTKMGERQKPVLDIHSFQDDCQVSFLIRGNDVKLNHEAHSTLHKAAAQAAMLIGKLRERGIPADQLTYEFDRESLLWFPSFAILEDGRMVSDRMKLIAIEQLPTGLSVGLTRGNFTAPVARTIPDSSDEYRD